MFKTFLSGLIIAIGDLFKVNMKPRIKFFLFYICYWLLIFVLSKIVFLLYQHHQSFDLTFIDWINVIRHGFKLDVSTTGYFLLFPSLLIAATSYLSWKVSYYIMNAYTFLMLVVFLVLTLVDFEIYKYWGTRLDTEPLRFFTTPAQTLASSSLLTILIFLFAFIFSAYILFKIYLQYISSNIKYMNPAKWQGILVFLLLTAFLFLPIRGGTGVAVINIGNVYFHQNSFANHAAINVVWNFGKSVVERKEFDNPYVYFTDEHYADELKKMYTSSDSAYRVLKTTRPNIVIIILESFSAKLIEPLGGEPFITPYFNELSAEGVFFSRIYSADSRTDKGLAAILSGYPVLEAIPILRYPEKSTLLPFLSSSLVHEGYNASFSYGGEIDFANMRSYLVNGNFIRITSDEDYHSPERPGKWGIHDHIMFERFFEEVTNTSQPFLKVLLTISNHEPFELPVTPQFGNANLKEKFFSAAHYTDSCLGSFIQKLKQTTLWDSLLVVLIPDHGSRLPDYCESYDSGKHHIPMLWTGGAVMMDTVVAKYGSQADLAVTLLHQMDIRTDEYILGKDLLSPSSQSFAFYSYKNGIGLLTDTSGFGLDLISGDISYSYGRVDDVVVDYAKALQQFMYDNYLNLSNPLKTSTSQRN